MMGGFWRTVSNRWLYLAGALFAGGLIGFALYLQYVEYQDPCPLCMVQRLVFVAILAVYGIAALHGPKRTGERVYGAIVAFFSILGVLVAARHIWIQHLPADQVPSCGPGLDYMIETMPMSDLFKELLHGSGECAAKGWTFLTIGIPEWSLLCYLALGTWAWVIVFRR